MLGAIIKKYSLAVVKALFLNIMQFISPFYDENSKSFVNVNYRNVSC